ncbi:MAG TPA: hypothetical protein ENN81_03835 [Phycisphaerales bacterium]|nr:hypothetical protein [Phycisphaerales bacterium]
MAQRWDRAEPGQAAVCADFRCTVDYRSCAIAFRSKQVLRDLGDTQHGRAAVFASADGAYGVEVEGFGTIIRDAGGRLNVLLDRQAAQSAEDSPGRWLGCEILTSHYMTVAGYCLAHAGGVCRDGRCVLWTGESGAGKTTRVLELVAAGWDYIGDDVVMLRPGPAGWEVSPYRRTAHVSVDTCRRFVQLSGLAGRKPFGDKHLFDIAQYFDTRIPDRAAVDEIYFLHGVGDEPPRRLSASEAFECLAPGFLYYIWPDDGPGMLDMVLAMASEVPVYGIGRGAEYER